MSTSTSRCLICMIIVIAQEHDLILIAESNHNSEAYSSTLKFKLTTQPYNGSSGWMKLFFGPDGGGCPNPYSLESRAVAPSSICSTKNSMDQLARQSFHTSMVAGGGRQHSIAIATKKMHCLANKLWITQCYFTNRLLTSESGTKIKSIKIKIYGVHPSRHYPPSSGEETKMKTQHRFIIRWW